jgi:hypothetical protein
MATSLRFISCDQTPAVFGNWVQCAWDEMAKRGVENKYPYFPATIRHVDYDSKHMCAWRLAKYLLKVLLADVKEDTILIVGDSTTHFPCWKGWSREELAEYYSKVTGKNILLYSESGAGFVKKYHPEENIEPISQQVTNFRHDHPGLIPDIILIIGGWNDGWEQEWRVRRGVQNTMYPFGDFSGYWHKCQFWEDWEWHLLDDICSWEDE